MFSTFNNGILYSDLWVHQLLKIQFDCFFDFLQLLQFELELTYYWTMVTPAICPWVCLREFHCSFEYVIYCDIVNLVS